MDFEQAGKLILGVILLILVIALVIVRRGMKPEPIPEATRIAGASLHTLQDIDGKLGLIADYLKPEMIRIVEAPKSKPGPERSQKQTRKVRAGTSR